MGKVFHRRRGLAAAAATAAAALGFCGVCRAAFTMPLGGGIGRFLEALGGIRGYSAKCEVNGAAATVAATGFEGRTPRAVAAECAARLSLPPDAVPLGGGIVAGDGEGGKVLLVPDGAGGCVAWTISVSGGGGPRDPAGGDDAPLSPLAEPLFHAVNRASGAALAVGEAAGDPLALRESQGAHLVARGWEALDPGGDAGIDLFARDGRICVVWAGLSPDGGRARLAVFCRGGTAP